MKTLSSPRKKSRRQYSDRFKAELVAEFLQGAHSLTSLAVANGMNPNVLHRWVNEHERFGRHDLSQLETQVPCAPKPAGWIPVTSTPPAVEPSAADAVQPPSLRPSQSDAKVSIELSGHNGIQLKLHWPSDDPQGLARFARELLT